MKEFNQYWGRPYVELEELVWERIMLFQDAWQRGSFTEAQTHERELGLLMDAVSAYERGGGN